MLSGLTLAVVFSVYDSSVSAFITDSGKDAEQYLVKCFNPAQGKIQLRKWDLKIENGFFRLKKYFPNGKQEYFSFRFDKFEDLNYSGTEESGELAIRTTGDDIIIQTYNDPQGNVDSMSSCIKVALKNIQVEQLNLLQKDFLEIRTQLK
ncbi:hypothetical protein [Rubrolithibacter danxiaensis]|uniref:hypothetical protein n=1 Tax=Rubrolithibacter danxiaensis TaxID=3390805 RepID=UPI003BF8FE4F